MDGHRVAVPGLPRPDDLLRVSCASRTFCALVDETGLSWFWHGSSWTGPVRYAPDSAPGALVSCPSSTFCMASAAAHTFVWRGASWAGTPKVSWPTAVTALACAGPGYCLAGPATKAGTDVRAWRGTAWSAAPEADAGATPAALSCARDGDTCALLGLGKAFTVHHGGAWGQPFVPTDTGLDVACAGGGFCMAAAHDQYAVWRGGAWTQRPLRYGIQLGAVSCASPAFCLGVDRQALAVWNGVDWAPGPALPSDAQPLMFDVAGGFPSCPDDGWCMFVAPGVTYVFSE